jgi:hypothetical protein
MEGVTGILVPELLGAVPVITALLLTPLEVEIEFAELSTLMVFVAVVVAVAWPLANTITVVLFILYLRAVVVAVGLCMVPL